MILIGTSGYSYADWKGFFYPPQTAERDFLEYYARHFNVCELNFTYYQIPSPRTFERMIEKSGGKVEFVAKAHQSITHGRDAGIEGITRFGKALEPLWRAKLLGGILLQFPFSFRSEKINYEYVRRLRDSFADLPLVAEFRKRSWIKERTFDFLRELNVGFCNVDEPQLPGLMPPTAETTSEIGYFRFHGRNQAKWWEHQDQAERYDYLYTEEELREWVPRIRKVESKTKKTYVFTNNHFQAQAVKNAGMLKDLLLPQPSPLEGEDSSRVKSRE